MAIQIVDGEARLPSESDLSGFSEVGYKEALSSIARTNRNKPDCVPNLDFSRVPSLSLTIKKVVKESTPDCNENQEKSSEPIVKTKELKGPILRPSESMSISSPPSKPSPQKDNQKYNSSINSAIWIVLVILSVETIIDTLTWTTLFPAFTKKIYKVAESYSQTGASYPIVMIATLMFIDLFNIPGKTAFKSFVICIKEKSIIGTAVIYFCADIFFKGAMFWLVKHYFLRKDYFQSIANSTLCKSLSNHASGRAQLFLVLLLFSISYCYPAVVLLACSGLTSVKFLSLVPLLVLLQNIEYLIMGLEGYKGAMSMLAEGPHFSPSGTAYFLIMNYIRLLCLLIVVIRFLQTNVFKKANIVTQSTTSTIAPALKIEIA